ncbi:C_GCAxxG_C_C family probable redox protein [Desulfitispora alkaliphila]|uniref:C-GCAxxG-C-C family (seleno)protein n=1 Tax=Desulfitispora alkaliphila TaxID=622674 RepID=UPI003D1A5663
MEEKALEARNKAGDYFKQGYNCAEAIYLAFIDLNMIDGDRNAVRMLTGFGGGMGEAGCSCGALTGSVVVLNHINGRTTTEADRHRAYTHAKAFHNVFKEKFGSTCCRSLNKYEFDSKEHLKNCLKITGNTAKLLQEYLGNNN